MLLNPSAFRAAGAALAFGAGLGCGGSPPIQKFSDDSFSECFPAASSPKTARCLGVFSEYHLKCSASPLLPEPSSSQQATEPYLDYFNCLWTDRQDLAGGLRLLNEDIVSKLPESGREAVQAGIFRFYPELSMEKNVAARRIEKSPNPEPVLEDVPISDRAFVFEGRLYLRRSENSPARRWTLAAQNPSRAEQDWDASKKKWEEVVDPCPVAPCNAKTYPGSRDSGETASDVRLIALGKTEGTFSVKYDTVQVPDQLSVFYQGALVWTSGCVGREGNSGPISFKGDSAYAKIRVTPKCDLPEGLRNDPLIGGIFTKKDFRTVWQYQIVCPK